jgi:hypothetical protein
LFSARNASAIVTSNVEPPPTTMNNAVGAFSVGEAQQEGDRDEGSTASTRLDRDVERPRETERT